jgi:DNA transposition AAA+ family ATPase
MEATAETKSKRPNQVIYWDDTHIETETAQMPPALREGYRWLKLYAREECKRDVDVLTAKFRDRGVTIDKTNWTRVLKGRWKKDAYGEEIPTPCIAAANLLQSITALREQVRVEILQGRMPFVETDTFHTIRRFVEKKMKPDRVNRFGVITGPTGTQKSASYKELARRNPKIKWLEAPDNASLKEFVLRLAVKCGASRNASHTSARARIFEDIGREHCIIIDNTQDLVRSKRELTQMGKQDYTQPAYQFMRSLQDENDCTFIWSITPENEDMMFDSKSLYYEQFEGRAGGRDGFLRLQDYPPRKDLIKIAEALGLRNAERHADLLVEIGKERGRIRRFFEILQEAKNAAEAESERLTIEHIEEQLEERRSEETSRRAVEQNRR